MVEVGSEVWNWIALAAVSDVVLSGVLVVVLDGAGTAGRPLTNYSHSHRTEVQCHLSFIYPSSQLLHVANIYIIYYMHQDMHLLEQVTSILAGSRFANSKLSMF